MRARHDIETAISTPVGRLSAFFERRLYAALAMIRDRWLIVLYVAASLAFTHNVFATVWLGTGLLYYPSKLLFWQPVHDGIAMTLVYLALMTIFFLPTLRRRTQPVGEAS